MTTSSPPIVLENFEEQEFDSYRNLRQELFKLIGKSERTDGDKYVVIDRICSYSLNPDNDESPFGADYVSSTQRSHLPSDLTEAEIETCIQLAEHSPSPLIKARASDVLWHLRATNSPFKFCDIAAKFYLESYQLNSDENKWIHIGSDFKRGLKLAKKQGTSRPVYLNYITAIEANLNEFEHITLHADALFYFQILADIKHPNFENYASRCESIAERIESSGNFQLSHQYLDLAQQFLRSSKKHTDIDRLKIKEGSSLIKQASEAQKSHGVLAGSHHLARAIKLLEQTNFDRTDLQAERRKLILWQQGIMNEMSTSEIEQDISEFIRESIKSVQSSSLEEALFKFAQYPLLDTEVLKRRVEIQKNTSLSHFLGATSIISHDGRTIAKQADLSNDDSVDAIEQEMIRHAHRVGWKLRAQGFINPARCEIVSQYHPTTDDLLFLVQHSPFIRSGHENIYLRGIVAGFEGDFLLATHFLAPQIEESIRYVLQQEGVVTSTMDETFVQDERSLGTLLSFPETVEILGENTVFEIRGLLCSRFGCNLRNQMAHGMMTHNEFYSFGGLNLWWLVIRLLCIPHINQSTPNN